MRTTALSICIAVLLAALAPSPAHADQVSETLGKCLGDNTTGKERKELARWIFLMMSTHPELRGTFPTSEPVRDSADQVMGALVTRLMTEACVAETKAAIEQKGPMAFEEAFGRLGQLAMMELMSDQNVRQATTNFVKYMDKAKFDETFKTQ